MRIEDLSDRSRLARRRFLKACAAMGISAGLAEMMAAGGADAQVADAPKKGGTLVMAISGDPASSNPDTTTSAIDYALGQLVYEGLTQIGDDFTPQPCLAKSWRISDDGKTYTFDLVDTRWHDGQPFTAADVKYSIEEVCAKFSPTFAATARLIESVGAPDDRTVVIRTRETFGPLLFSLSAYSGAAILPKHLFENTDVLTNPASLDKPVGTGPFVLDGWARGDRITLRRNETYWLQGRPYLDGIVLKIIPDANARVLALKAGEIDYCRYFFFPSSRVAEAKNDPSLQTRERAVPEDKLIIFNNRQAQLRDRRVREALLRSTDREYIRKVVFHGLGGVMKNHIDSRIQWASAADVDLGKIYPPDVGAAKKLLDDAGYPVGANGRRFDLRIAFETADSDWGRLAQTLQSMWQKVQVGVILDGNQRPVVLQKAFTDWDYDVLLWSYSTTGDPALGIARLYVSSFVQRKPFVNVSGYSRPEVDEQFDAGARAVDLARRGEAYRRVCSLLAQDLPLIPLVETAAVNVAGPRLRGTWAYGVGNTNWEGVWLE